MLRNVTFFGTFCTIKSDIPQKLVLGVKKCSNNIFFEILIKNICHIKMIKKKKKRIFPPNRDFLDFQSFRFLFKNFDIFHILIFFQKKKTFQIFNNKKSFFFLKIFNNFSDFHIFFQKNRYFLRFSRFWRFFQKIQDFQIFRFSKKCRYFFRFSKLSFVTNTYLF